MRSDRNLLAATLALVTLSACSGSRGSSHVASTATSTSPPARTTPAAASPGPVGASGVAPVASASPTSPVVAAAPDDGTVPVILLHGLGGSPAGLSVLGDRLAAGRTLVRELYLDEADALKPGDLAPDAVVVFGYYQRSATAARFDPDASGQSHLSIGACPVPRTDGLDKTLYTESYAERLQHCVDGVLRATGKSQVDLVGHSMGGVVARAYTKWLSVDANNHTPVRRVLLLGSPSRGLNALEALLLASQQSGATEFMRLGECVELCREEPLYEGRSYPDILNDGWDAFCSQHGIEYGGLAGTGAYGPQPPIFTATQVQAAVGKLTPGVLAALAGAAAILWGDVSTEIQEILAPNDGEVPLPVARLDAAPFLGARPSLLVEARHVYETDTERSLNQSTLAAEVVRRFTIASGSFTSPAACSPLALVPVDAPGRATWLEATVEIQGAGALAAELVEETLDASGNAVSAAGYGHALRPGRQSLAFVVAAGGGTRRYHLVVYGERGTLAVLDTAPLTLHDGALETEPAATIGAVTTTTSSAGPIAHALLASNAAPGDPALGYRVRVDHGGWSSPLSVPTADTPPLGPGLHRLEVVASSSSNAAGIPVDGTVPAAVDLIVDARGSVTVVR